jgi:hypothetical protein
MDYKRRASALAQKSWLGYFVFWLLRCLIQNPLDFKYFLLTLRTVFKKKHLRSWSFFQESSLFFFNYFITVFKSSRFGKKTPEELPTIDTYLNGLLVSEEFLVKKNEILNSKKKRSYDLAVCVMFKNESSVIKEWIDHYIFHGVDHIFMINDGSTDGFLEVLKPYLEKGYVTLFDSSKFPRIKNRQIFIYNLFLLYECRYLNWIAFLDMDEFLYSPQEINLKKVLKNYENYSQVTIPWVIFNSNGLEVQPRSVVQGFKKVNLNFEDPAYLAQFKSIVKGKKLISIEVHKHIVKGATHDISQVSNSKPHFLVNHYLSQSREYWKKKKILNGCVNQYVPLDLRGWDLFDRINLGNDEDLRLYEQNKEII